jgi:CcmD family protein
MSDLYIVLVVCLMAWLGIFLYLLNLDLRIKKLEKKDEK